MFSIKKLNKNHRKYVSKAKKLAELPPNVGDPEYFKNYILRNFKDACVYNSNEIINSFPLVFSVDFYDPYVAVIHHKFKDMTEKPIVLIGKGVCFDSGGYNIKGDDMWEMKYDKCGATAVIAIMEYLRDIDFPRPVIAILPFVQNLVGSSTTLPGSVFRSRAGIKVDVRDTDAEGRLILADCIDYAKIYSPELIITIATLTGSCEAALGDIYSGLFSIGCTANKYVDFLKAAAYETDDLIWPMPLHINHLENLYDKNTKILKNYNKKERGGSSGFAFLSFFAEAMPFIHLDIAGTAFNGDKDEATGRPVPLLCNFFDSIK